MKKRVASRKAIEPLSLSSVTTLLHYEKIAQSAMLVDVSATGFLMHVKRTELIPKHLRENLTINSIEGEPVTLKIDPMDLEISGHVARTKYIGKGVFEVAVDFSEDAPEYWRECLFDLLS